MSNGTNDGFVTYLPPSLREVYNAEICLIGGGRKETLDYLKARIDTESKLLKDWLALIPPPPQGAGYTRQQIEAATDWYDEKKGELESALADAKEQKVDVENQIKLQSELPALGKQRAEEQINKLKDLQKQREALKKQCDSLEASIKTAEEEEFKDLVTEYKAEKEKIEAAIADLKTQEDTASQGVQTAINEWRTKHKALETKVAESDGLVALAEQIEKLMKDISYFNTYQDDIIDQWLQTEFPPEPADSTSSSS